MDLAFIGDIASYKTNIGLFKRSPKTPQVAGISQLVENDEAMALRSRKKMVNKITSDEPGSTSNDDVHKESPWSAKLIFCFRIIPSPDAGA